MVRVSLLEVSQLIMQTFGNLPYMGVIVDEHPVDGRSGGYGTTYTDMEPSSNTPAIRPSFLGEAGEGPDNFLLPHKS